MPKPPPLLPPIRLRRRRCSSSGRRCWGNCGRRRRSRSSSSSSNQCSSGNRRSGAAAAAGSRVSGAGTSPRITVRCAHADAGRGGSATRTPSSGSPHVSGKTNVGETALNFQVRVLAALSASATDDGFRPTRLLSFDPPTAFGRRAVRSLSSRAWKYLLLLNCACRCRCGRNPDIRKSEPRAPETPRTAAASLIRHEYIRFS